MADGEHVAAGGRAAFDVLSGERRARQTAYNGDGALTAQAGAADAADSFTYDPMNPVPSYGGNVCCTGNAVTGGAFDQRKMEAREDILVYTTEPLKEGMEVSGPMEATLYVSSDVKDTDFTVKVIDVYPDGKAYNLMRRFSAAVIERGMTSRRFGWRRTRFTSSLCSR